MVYIDAPLAQSADGSLDGVTNSATYEGEANFPRESAGEKNRTRLGEVARCAALWRNSFREDATPYPRTHAIGA